MILSDSSSSIYYPSWEALEGIYHRNAPEFSTERRVRNFLDLSSSDSYQRDTPLTHGVLYEAQELALEYILRDVNAGAPLFLLTKKITPLFKQVIKKIGDQIKTLNLNECETALAIMTILCCPNVQVVSLGGGPDNPVTLDFLRSRPSIRVLRSSTQEEPFADSLSKYV